MVENFSSYYKDNFVLKLPKMFSLILRMIILVIAMICGVYMCSVCLKPITEQTKPSTEVVERLDGCCKNNSLENDQTKLSTEVVGNLDGCCTNNRLENDQRKPGIELVGRLNGCCKNNSLENDQTKSSTEVVGKLDGCCKNNTLEHQYLHYPQPETFSRDECAGNPVLFFVIISMQRSGSGWFETLLNSHTNASSNGEIFSAKKRRNKISSIIRTLDQVYNLDWLGSASKNECSAAVGFKWMLNQGLMDHPKEIVEYFNRRSVSVIFLFRRNPLRRLISILANSFDRKAKQLNGTHKAHVHSQEEAKTLSRHKPLVNSKSLLSSLKVAELAMSQSFAYFNSTLHISLYYEDLIKNRTKLDDVQDFLGVPLMKLKSRQIKIHRGPLREHIKNWEAVSMKLNGTAYEKFLYPDY